jgi:hypothetical protein
VASSPTQRSLKLLRDAGYICHIVEKYNSFTRTRSDVYGFGDILACKASQNGSYLVQTTSRANLNARINKIMAIPEAVIWLRAGNGILVHGWSKMGKAGKRKLWHCEVRCLSLDMFPSPNYYGKSIADMLLSDTKDALCPKSENCLSSGGI